MELGHINENKLELFNSKKGITPNGYTLTNPELMTETDLNNLDLYQVEHIEVSNEEYEVKDSFTWEKVNNKIQITPTYKDMEVDKFLNFKIETLKQTYYELTQEGFTCSNGIKIDCRKKDKINWLAARFQDKDEYTVMDFDNLTHDVTKEEFNTMITELENYYEKLLKDKWTIVTILKSKTTLNDLNDVYWRKKVNNEWVYNPILGA